MLAVNGYYDGGVFHPMEKLNAKKYQRAIITLLDDFAEIKRETKEVLGGKTTSAFGIASKYANPDLIPQEEGAFARAMVEKHENYENHH